MNKSEQINELAAALVEAQKKIKGAVKDSQNPFFKSRYADLESVQDACKEALLNNGLAVSQVFGVKDGKQVLTTVLMHKSGQWISGEQELVSKDNTPQGFGSASTYARRYGLAAIVGVVQTDDDAETGMNREKQIPSFQRPPQQSRPPQGGGSFRP